MTIKIGDSLPDCQLMQKIDGKPQPCGTLSLFGGKTAVLFAVPGAFTPTCSEKHLPGYVDNLSRLHERGAEVVACVSVNDAFVMHAWRQALSVPDELLMLSDGSAEFTRACGLELDLTAMGMGIRSKRYALIARDNKVEHFAVEAGGEFGVSGAEAILEHL